MKPLLYAISGCIFVLVIFLIIEFVVKLPSVGSTFPDALPGVTGKAIDTLVGLTSLFVTLALGVFGGIGFFIKSFLKSEVGIDRNEALLLGGSAVVALLSIFAGHLVYWNIVRSLGNYFIEFDSTAIRLPVALQYLSLVIAVILLFASVFLATLRKGFGEKGRGVSAPERPNTEVLFP